MHCKKLQCTFTLSITKKLSVMQLNSTKQYKDLIIEETETMVTVGNSIEAVEAISQEILEKTNYQCGAFYGPYNNDGVLFYRIEKQN